MASVSIKWYPNQPVQAAQAHKKLIINIITKGGNDKYDSVQVPYSHHSNLLQVNTTFNPQTSRITSEPYFSEANTQV